MARASFRGSTAIVTGGASGIGRAIGAELHRHGAHVVLADIDGAGADIAARDIAAEGTAEDTSGGSITARRLDVCDPDAVDDVVAAVAERHGRIDLLFNNAGISMGGPTEDLRPEQWRRIVDVNLLGVANGVAAAYPRMIAQGRGHIVNTASAAGLVSTVFTVAYSATKHAVVGLSTALRPEAAAHGVRVSVLCPGAVDTPILDRGGPDDVPDRVSALTPRQYLAEIGLSPGPPDALARKALRGVARNRAIIAPGVVRGLWVLYRISPAAAERVNRSNARKVRRRVDTAATDDAPSA